VVLNQQAVEIGRTKNMIAYGKNCNSPNIRDESWRARTPERTGNVQARTVGITALGEDWAVADEAQTYCPPFDVTQGGE
jgi:hypothetical protein